jgi:hypothetical protein
MRKLLLLSLGATVPFRHIRPESTKNEVLVIFFLQRHDSEVPQMCARSRIRLSPKSSRGPRRAELLPFAVHHRRNERFGEGDSESTTLLKKMDLSQEPVSESFRIQVEGEVIREG